MFNTQNFQDIYRPILPTEKNMVDLMALHIEHIIGRNERNIFESINSIKEVQGLNPLIQRVTINSLFRQYIFIYSGINKVDMYDTISFISDDLDEYIWIDAMDRYVLKAFKDFDIFNIKIQD